MRARIIGVLVVAAVAAVVAIQLVDSDKVGRGKIVTGGPQLIATTATASEVA